MSVAGARAGYLLFDITAHLFMSGRPLRIGAEHYSNEELIFLVTILHEKDVTGLNRAINRASEFALSLTFTHQAFVLCITLLGLRGDFSSTSKTHLGHNSVGCFLSHDWQVSSFPSSNKL